MRRAVLQNTAGHPLSVYPTVLAVLGGLALLLFGPSAVLVAGVSGLASVGLASWLINYFFRRESFASRYLRKAHEALERETRRKLRNLEEELRELDLQQGVVQLARFREKLDTLTTLLKRKLDESELTYGRYLGMAEQVYLAAVDNLHEAALAARTARAIDLRYVEQRLAVLEKEDSASPDVAGELEALRGRREIHAEQSARVAELLSRNEAAMTQLDRTSAAIAAVRTQAGHASMDFETAMSELAILAKRAHKYSSR